MRGKLLLCLSLLAAGLIARPAAAQEKAGAKPFLVAHVKAIDDLISDFRYLAELGGRAEEAKQLEKMLKAKTGPKGLGGVDTKKPLGAYGLVSKKLDESQVLVLLPVADQETLLDTLDALGSRAEKGKDGIYTAEVAGLPYPVAFRFANGYAYATVKVTDKQLAGLDKNKLPKPEDVFAEGAGSLVALTVNLDQLPAGLKRAATVQVSQALADAKEKAPPGGETEKQKEFRLAVLDELAVQAKALIEGSGALTLRADLDRKSNDLSLGLSLKGEPGSTLAKNIASLAPTTSVSASLLAKNSVMNGALHLALPASVRKAVEPVLDEGFKKALESESDAEKREVGRALIDAITPTLKAGVLDVGFDLRGPGKEDKYTLVLGMQVKDGPALDKALRKAVAALPAGEKENVKLDAVKEDGIAITEIKPKNADENTKRVLGEGPGYLAIRKDAFFIAFGADALEAMKGALKAEPGTAKVINLGLSLKGLIPLAPNDQKEAETAAKSAFAEKESDRVNLSVEGGKTLQVKVRIKAQVLAFLSLLDKARKEKESDK
jgi:hypothetical protein